MSKKHQYQGLPDLPDFDEWAPSSSLQVVVNKEGESYIVAMPDPDSAGMKRLEAYGLADLSVLKDNLLEIDGGCLEGEETNIPTEDHYGLEFAMLGVVDGMCAAKHYGVKYGDDSERII